MLIYVLLFTTLYPGYSQCLAPRLLKYWTIGDLPIANKCDFCVDIIMEPSAEKYIASVNMSQPHVIIQDFEANVTKECRKKMMDIVNCYSLCAKVQLRNNKGRLMGEIRHCSTHIIRNINVTINNTVAFELREKKVFRKNIWEKTGTLFVEFYDRSKDPQINQFFIVIFENYELILFSMCFLLFTCTIFLLFCMKVPRKQIEETNSFERNYFINGLLYTETVAPFAYKVTMADLMCDDDSYSFDSDEEQNTIIDISQIADPNVA